MENPLEFPDATRRDVLRKAVFVAPVILTLPVIASVARAGSSEDDPEDHGEQGEGGSTTGATGGSQGQGGRRRHRRGWWIFNW